MSSRRLYRCRHDRQLAGVSAGMAEYFDLDPTVVRVLWILSVFFGGFSILVYLVLAIVIPLEPVAAAATAAPGSPGYGTGPVGTTEGDPAAVTSGWHVPAAAMAGHEHRQRGDGRFGLAIGVLLVVFGSIALLGPIVPGWLAGVALGPAFIVALGVAFIAFAVRRPATEL